MRVNVVGTSGSGKTTVSRRIAEKLNVPHVEMDALFWKPNWTESTDDEFFPMLEDALSSNAWVLDGNYDRTRPIKWKRVQTVVYLDLPFLVVLCRMVRRCLVRGLKREELWAGNTESIWKHIFTRDSMILWTISSFHRVRRRYEKAFEMPEYSDIRFVRLRSRKEVEDFVERISPESASDPGTVGP